MSRPIIVREPVRDRAVVNVDQWAPDLDHYGPILACIFEWKERVQKVTSDRDWKLSEPGDRGSSDLRDTAGSVATTVAVDAAEGWFSSFIRSCATLAHEGVGHRPCRRERQGLSLAQVLPFEELHGDVGLVAVDAVIEDLDDVRRAEIGGDVCLALEAGPRVHDVGHTAGTCRAWAASN